ncbi:transketolase [Hwanghaeella sp.]|uniref:transketolase n=1 Tax=Hwanghaeella sp. TaxID=2605943 RepID=UPI003CCC0432
MTAIKHSDMANAIRALSMDAIQKANSGHPGMPMGMADVATVLFTKFLKFDASKPDWPDRDRFVLSAGHGSMLLYSILHLTGYKDMSLAQIKNFRQFGSKTAGHPEYGHAAGIETTTGPLGQGLANAVGMALAERMAEARHGKQLVDHYTYVIAGDGCLMEGISHEAISLAGHLGLGKLIVLFDDNHISIDGPTELTVSDDQLKRFQASGWDTQAVDGHDPEAVEKAISAAQKTNTPSLIACRTVIGYGAPTKAGSASTHGAPLGNEEIAGAREKLGWDAKPFVIPKDILKAWRDAGKRGEKPRKAWEGRLKKKNVEDRRAFNDFIKTDLPEDFDKIVASYKKELSKAAPTIATRAASQKALEVLTAAVPSMVGGSADLTGSNLTQTGIMPPVTAKDASGRYIFYGVREHGMAAAMNGIALHGGFIPYGGTFLVFTDYCRPSIRLSALMEQRVIYVMTHDSIGLGEDGPTHQPVEHVASLRAMPNVTVLRPCDAVETTEAWQIALENKTGPSVLALSRQGLPTLRTKHSARNLSAKGGYVLQEAEVGPRQVTLMATGSEVSLAAEARAILEKKKIGTAVVSMPSLDLFAKQSAKYQDSVLGENAVRVAVEAGVRQSWDQWLCPDGAFVGMDSFGASAPAGELYEHFGITADAVVKQAVGILKARSKRDK